MIATVVSVVALAGTVMAGCPLAVEIVGATNHVAQVSVTNTGSETITVFKGNTVLSDHATKDLDVSDAGMPKISTLTQTVANAVGSRQCNPL
jgi:deuterolysin